MAPGLRMFMYHYSLLFACKSPDQTLKPQVNCAVFYVHCPPCLSTRVLCTRSLPRPVWALVFYVHGPPCLSTSVGLNIFYQKKRIGHGVQHDNALSSTSVLCTWSPLLEHLCSMYMVPPVWALVFYVHSPPCLSTCVLCTWSSLFEHLCSMHIVPLFEHS